MKTLPTIALLTLFFGCTDQNPGQSHSPPNESPGVIQGNGLALRSNLDHVVWEAPSVVFSGTTDGKAKLLYKTKDNRIQEAVIRDGNAKNVELTIENTFPLTRDYLVLNYTRFPDVKGKALLRVADGKLFNVSAYDFQGYPVEIKEDYLFAVETVKQVLHRISLDTFVATPVHNPSYDPLGHSTWSHLTFPFFVDRNLTVAVSTRTPNIECMDGAGCFTLFFNDETPPFHSSVTGNQLVTVGGGTVAAQMYGIDRELYRVNAVSSWNASDHKYIGADLVVEQISTDKEIGVKFKKMQVLSNLGLGGFTGLVSSFKNRHDRDWVILMTNGFVRTTSTEKGGIQLEPVLTDIPDVKGNDQAKIVGDYLYWSKQGEIFRQELSRGAQPESLARVNNFIGFTVVGTTVVYTRYVTSTHIATYNLEPGKLAVKIADEDMKIGQIVEIKL